MKPAPAKLRFHPASEIFPLMEGEELESLAQDIREHGLREPITLHPDGSILDGRNRYVVCLRIGVEPTYRTWEGQGSPVDFVISLNLKRRQLTPSQRAMVGLKARPLLEAEARERQRMAGQAPGHAGPGSRTLATRVAKVPSAGRANELAGTAVGVSGKSVERAALVVERGVPELVEAVKTGAMAVKRAALIARAPQSEQRRLMDVPTKDVRKETANDTSTKKEEQAPVGTRRLPKHTAAADFRRSVQTLQGICLGLAKLNTAEIFEASDASSLRDALREAISTLRGVYRALGGNGESHG